eukprot:2180253-Karenia_brevis.AAC.1
MDDLHRMNYLDGRPSPHELLGWTTFAVPIAWIDDLHHLAGRLSLPGLLGWTTFITLMDVCGVHM